MRLNQFLASASGISRRRADDVIAAGQVSVNEQPGVLGQQIDPDKDQIKLDGQVVTMPLYHSIVLNKPTGFVTSKAGQGSQTIYDLLPSEFASLKPAGRLDKDSTGLIILTNDGNLANRLIHPSAGKTKRYLVKLNRTLSDEDLERIKQGIKLAEGVSQMNVTQSDGDRVVLELATGWNRQIRRTFEALNYRVVALQRVSIGKIELGSLEAGKWRELTKQEAAWLASS